MKSFIDTQLLIGLFNPKDAYHNKAKKLLSSKDVVLLESVRKEARGTFLRKYNEACIRLLQIVNEIRCSDLIDPEDILKFAEKKLRRLISRNVVEGNL